MLSRIVTSIQVTNNTVQSTSARGVGTDTGAAVMRHRKSFTPLELHGCRLLFTQC